MKIIILQIAQIAGFLFLLASQPSLAADGDRDNLAGAAPANGTGTDPDDEYLVGIPISEPTAQPTAQPTGTPARTGTGGPEVDNFNTGQMRNGRVVICAAAANAAYANNQFADSLLESCVLAIKANDRAPPAGLAASPGGGSGRVNASSIVPPDRMKKIFRTFTKNYSVKRGEFSKSLKQDNAFDNFSNMLKGALPADRYAKVAVAIDKAAAKAAEEQRKLDEYELKLGQPLKSNAPKSLRDSLKEKLDASAAARGNAKANAPKGQPTRRAASNVPFTSTNLKDVKLSAEDQALFTLPEPVQAAPEPEMELSLFDVVRNKYREKFEMLDPKAFGLKSARQ